ncbi:MAG: NINE protein, partial [Phototrophicaceae bacterium]
DLLSKINQLIDEDRESEAVPYIRQLLKVNPNNVEALLLYAQVTTNKQIAIETLQDILVIDPSNTKAKLQLRTFEREIADANEKAQNKVTPKEVSIDNGQLLMQQMLQQNQMLMSEMRQSKEKPIINIVNANNSTATANPTVNAVASVGGNVNLTGKSKYNRGVVFLICLFFGFFGFHRFYTGYIGIGILQLLTAGGFGIWWLLDAVIIISGNYRDKAGYIV